MSMTLRVGILSCVVASWATYASAQVKKQDADVTAADGVKIKVSYYPAGKPGVPLMHQCNRDRTTSRKIRRRIMSSPERNRQHPQAQAAVGSS
jgi:hypothetical protein